MKSCSGYGFGCLDHHAIIQSAERRRFTIMPSALISRRNALKTAALAAAVVPSALWGQSRATVIEDVARWIVDLRYEQLPPDAIAAAKRALFDSMGCLLGGIDAPPVRQAEQVVALQG